MLSLNARDSFGESTLKVVGYGACGCGLGSISSVAAVSGGSVAIASFFSASVPVAGIQFAVHAH